MQRFRRLCENFPKSNAKIWRTERKLYEKNTRKFRVLNLKLYLASNYKECK